MSKKRKNKISKALKTIIPLLGVGAVLAGRGRKNLIPGSNTSRQLKAEELVIKKAEKLLEAVVKSWLEEVKKQNTFKENKCQIKDTINKSLALKKVVRF